MPGPTFGFVKLLASSGSHCTKWADEQHRQAGFESRLVPDLPPLYPHFNRPSSFWPCVKSCLVGGSDKYRLALRLRILNLSFGLRGPSPQAFTSFGRVGFIARRLRRPKRGMPTWPRAFLESAGCAWATALHPDPP